MSNQLSWQEGDLVRVTHKAAGGWWACRNTQTGAEGIVPSTYLSHYLEPLTGT